MSLPIFTHRPDIAYRGSRGYIHSTDLYEEFCRGSSCGGIELQGPIDIKIKSKITRQVIFEYSEPRPLPRMSVASCSFKSGDVFWQVAVIETTDLVVETKGYDERPVVSSRIEGRSASLNAPTGLRPIECLTALAVHLHKIALPPPPGARWMLAQLTLNRPLQEQDAGLLSIKIDKVLGSTSSRTRIDAHDGQLGTMVFILV